MDGRWRLNEEDAWDEEYAAPDEAGGPSDDALAGQDEEGLVKVYVEHDGQVLSTVLATDWKKRLQPHELPQRIVTAANAATMEAVSKQMELMRFQQTIAEGIAPKQAGTSQAGTAQADGPPLAVDDVMQMIDTVSFELERFSRSMAEIANQTVTVDSAGGHVSGTAQQSQVLKISLDNGWASRSRNAEVENEITDVLTSLQRRSSPEELTKGPQSDSISQLMSLASDPHTLLRRLGLTK